MPKITEQRSVFQVLKYYIDTPWKLGPPTRLVALAGGVSDISPPLLLYFGKNLILFKYNINKVYRLSLIPPRSFLGKLSHWPEWVYPS